ncbi:protein POLYCHOME-like [Nicotiana tomentosiformis]|uniref:protein POLYCHOME-like n=1 Tax=Nicotiana tomentosiformis TaxID=4098 RepID=UPI00051C5077|nr:protein POLYCHOME-like [Nicotiana tomentosiformis]
MCLSLHYLSSHFPYKAKSNLNKNPNTKPSRFSRVEDLVRMAEGRDRLTRLEDPIYVYSRRRRSIGRGGIEIFEDEAEASTAAVPLRTTPVRTAGGGRGRNSSGTPARAIGSQNISPGGRGRWRGRRSVLPSWYPRTPLRDITSIVRAIERTRARLRESEGEQLERLLPQDHTVLDPSESTSGAQLELKDSMITPRPKVRSRYHPKSVGKVSKILLDITNQKSSEDTDCLTPQRKLLNSIDTAEKAVMDELHKMKRAPSARKEEREKRVKTLMSMR